jgi:hypothetical protein
MFKMTYENGAYNLIERKLLLLRDNTQKANHNLGENLAKAMQQTILTQSENWPPLSEQRIKEKGHSKALLDTFQLVNSIKAIYNGNSVEVGVHRNAPNNRGRIAATNEYGDPERRIPARPFVHSTWARERDRLITKWRNDLKF